MDALLAQECIIKRYYLSFKVILWRQNGRLWVIEGRLYFNEQNVGKKNYSPRFAMAIALQSSR